MAAIVIVILAALFVYGAATNEAYGWGTFGKYILDERIVSGVWITIQLTIWSMLLAILLAVILAVMRLSPNPVFRSVSWVYLWIFRGTPVFVQLVFWGLIPTIYKNIQLGIPFGPTFFHLNIQNLSMYYGAGDPRSGTQRGGLPGGDHPGRNQLGARRPVGGIHRAGHVVAA